MAPFIMNKAKKAKQYRFYNTQEYIVKSCAHQKVLAEDCYTYLLWWTPNRGFSKFHDGYCYPLAQDQVCFVVGDTKVEKNQRIKCNLINSPYYTEAVNIEVLGYAL